MNCERVQEMLWAFCEGALDGDRARGVEEHLGRCVACRSEMAGVRATLGALKLAGAASTIEPRADFQDRLRRKIDAWEERGRIGWLAMAGGFVRRNRRLLGTSSAAFVLALVGGLYVLGNMLGPAAIVDRGTGEPTVATTRGTGYEGIVPVSDRGSVAAQPGINQNFVMREIPYDARMVVVTGEEGADTVYIRFPTPEVTPPRGLQRDNYIYDPAVTPVSTSEPIY